MVHLQATTGRSGVGEADPVATGFVSRSFVKNDGPRTVSVGASLTNRKRIRRAIPCLWCRVVYTHSTTLSAREPPGSDGGGLSRQAARM